MVLNLNRLIHHFEIDQSFDKKPNIRIKKLKSEISEILNIEN